MITLRVIDLTFDSRKHVYTLNHAIVPGCSTISGMFPKGYLVPWAAKVTGQHIVKKIQELGLKTVDEIVPIIPEAAKEWQRQRDSAGDIGTSVHAVLEKHCKKIEQDELFLTECQKNALNNLREWEKKHNVEWLFNELMVGSSKHGFAGTLDAVALVDGRLCIVDFKTSNQLSSEYFCQMGGYGLAFEEMGGGSISGYYLLRFDKEKNVMDEVYVDGQEKLKECFLAALRFYRAHRAMEDLFKRVKEK